jgi:DNA-binding response OmpR family regulator
MMINVEVIGVYLQQRKTRRRTGVAGLRLLAGAGDAVLSNNSRYDNKHQSTNKSSSLLLPAMLLLLCCSHSCLGSSSRRGGGGGPCWIGVAAAFIVPLNKNNVMVTQPVLLGRRPHTSHRAGRDLDREFGMVPPAAAVHETRGSSKDGEHDVARTGVRTTSPTTSSDTLPVVSKTTTTSSSSPSSSSSLFLARNPHWILLVDDEEAIRQSVGDFLFDAGYEITACADAESARNVLIRSCRRRSRRQEQSNDDGDEMDVRTTPPGCAVLDIRMPGGPDGLELLKWIRTGSSSILKTNDYADDDESAVLQRLPIILLTAKGLTDDRIRGYAAGCDFYLPKPFVPDELLAMVDAAVQLQRQSSSPPPQLEHLYRQVDGIKARLRQQRQQFRTTGAPGGEPAPVVGTNNDPTKKVGSSSTTPISTYVYLTPSERHVLELLCDGLTNQEIAGVRQTSKVMVRIMVPVRG